MEPPLISLVPQHLHKTNPAEHFPQSSDKNRFTQLFDLAEIAERLTQ